MVRYFPQQYPQWGVLVDENGQIVNNLNIKCGEFKNRGFRYKHQKWPSPNRDFIPVTVEIIAHPSEWVVKSERHYIQVNVLGAEKNETVERNCSSDKPYILQGHQSNSEVCVQHQVIR